MARSTTSFSGMMPITEPIHAASRASGVEGTLFMSVYRDCTTTKPKSFGLPDSRVERLVQMGVFRRAAVSAAPVISNFVYVVMSQP